VGEALLLKDLAAGADEPGLGSRGEKTVRIVVMGTGPFAVPTFHALIASSHQIGALFTQPERVGPGRGKGAAKGAANPMRAAAEQAGIPVHDPPDVNSQAAQRTLRELAPDLLMVCDYGQILSDETLATARLGGVNLHGSLLPRYRGAAPVNWAILEGETETGVTVIHMSRRLDAGPILCGRRTGIGPDEDALQLENRLAELGVSAVREAIERLAAWDGSSPLGEPQDKRHVSRAPRLKKSDGRIDWNQPARRIVDQVRAFKPWPGSFTFVPHPGGNPQRLILDQVRWVAPPTDAPPGSIVAAGDGCLQVAAGDGARVQIERLQPAGKRVMASDEFLRGHPLRLGQRLE
jgi:methionyl-tRNA formyltransferase